MIPSWTAQENDCENNIESIIQLNQQLTNQDLPNEQSKTSKQPKTINRLSNRGRATHPRAVKLQQTKQLI